jgi:hypothetical protein
LPDTLRHRGAGAPGQDLDTERRRWLAPVSALVVIAIGRALQIVNGILHPDALFWITVALAVAIAGVVVARPARLARLDARIVLIVAVAGLTANIGQLYTKPPILVAGLPPESQADFSFRLALLTAAVFAAVGGAFRPGWRRLSIVALVAAHFALGAWAIEESPFPKIDVHVFQRDSIRALRRGANPYELTFPNIYDNASYYGPDLSVDGRLQFGFPYFPLSLLLATPGQILGRDHRYAQLVAMELAAILMVFCRPHGFGILAAALFLTTPRVFFVLEQAWTEPFVVFGLAAVVFAACRRPRATPWLFGAFVALKQYLVLAVPAASLIVRGRREVLHFMTRAAIAGAALTLPFVLWNPAAFWKSVVALQFHQPFRLDALSYLSWWTLRGHQQPPELISFVAAAIAAAVSLWRLPRTPAGLAAAVALTFFAFFAFNKQAFCNYYFFVIGAFAVTLAACAPREET